ncbi:MAG: adenylosuccinate synthase [candidate division Zixibacteria bacterium]|nr:adenylosuccinate synthase [candidate division Zixibacteria bacterium]
MSSTLVVGCQWGDEGKGKIVDILAEKADIIVRFQGGANAGHTVLTDSGQYILHLLPSGILRESKKCVIASGVVVDPEQVVNETAELEKLGIKVKGRLFISGKAHLVFPYHKFLDGYYENLKQCHHIGTTKRGIGPAYTDRAARTGIRMYDLVDENRFKDRLDYILDLKKKSIIGIKDQVEFDLQFNLDYARRVRDALMDYVTDTSLLISDALAVDTGVLFEGAQGTLLDVDHGTSPYTTSSNTIAGGLYAGCGISPFIPDKTIGVVKAYTTRVGEGPFPTQIDGDPGDVMRDKGGEFGATTGRPRRCGWLDMVALRYALRINGVNSIALTKLDVLSAMGKIKVCTAYRCGSTVLDEFPDDIYTLPHCEPLYTDFDGWDEDISEINDYNNLPVNTRKYITGLEELGGIRIKYISTGPARDKIIIK